MIKLKETAEQRFKEYVDWFNKMYEEVYQREKGLMERLGEQNDR